MKLLILNVSSWGYSSFSYVVLLGSPLCLCFSGYVCCLSAQSLRSGLTAPMIYLFSYVSFFFFFFLQHWRSFYLMYMHLTSSYGPLYTFHLVYIKPSHPDVRREHSRCTPGRLELVGLYATESVCVEILKYQYAQLVIISSVCQGYFLCLEVLWFVTHPTPFASRTLGLCLKSCSLLRDAFLSD